MEPDDLSFIEISGEDDSLLPAQNLPNDDISSLSNSYFAFSPLQIPRSDCSVNPPPLVSQIGNEDARKMNLLSNRDSVNKENVNSNKPEVPKLSMEPQQMKRKKKSGGYNLRKSLAWDKAFFTEEGVLDPLELSMISGNFDKASAEMLSVIKEDGRESLAGDSEDLTAEEENLSKALPMSNASEDTKSSCTLLPKNASSTGVNVASASVPKRKVLSTHDVNKNGSKRGVSPWAVASSSPKKPAKANTTKLAIKESKFPKIPVRKLDTSVHVATAKKNIPRASNSKQNQIAQQDDNHTPHAAAVGVQRNVGLKGSSHINKNARSDVKFGLAGRSVAVKSSVQQAKRNVSGSKLKILSATNSHNPCSKANNALKIDPGLLHPASGHESNKHDSNHKAAISLPSGGHIQYAQPQIAKPSGLRMPSPSLGFFNQSKTTAFHSSLLGSNQACSILESNIPSFRKFVAKNAIQETLLPAPGKRTGVANDTRLPSSLRGSSTPTSLSTNSCEKMKSDLHILEIQKEELELQSISNSLGILNNQQNLHGLSNDIEQQSLENARPSKNEKISHVVHNDNELLLPSAPGDQLQKDHDDDRVYPMSVDLSGPERENPPFASYLNPTVQAKGVFETKDMIDNQFTEEKTCNSSIKNYAASLELQSGDANSHSIKGTMKRNDDWVSSVHDVNVQSIEQTETMMPYPHQVEQYSSEGQSLWLKNGDLSSKCSSSEFQNCKSAKIEDASPEVGHSGGGVEEISHGQPPSKEAVEAVDFETRVHFLTKSQVGDTEMQSVDGIVSAGSSEVFLCSSATDKMVVDDVNDNVIDANGNGLKSSDAFCSIPPALQDCGFHVAKTAEGPRGDDSFTGLPDVHFSHDIKLHGQTTSEELEIIGNNQTTMVTTTHVEVSNVYPNIADFSGCELDLQCFATQPVALEQTRNDSEVKNIISLVQVKYDYGIVDVSEHKDLGNKQYELSVNNHCPNSDLQPADDISHCQQAASIVFNDRLSYIHNGCKQTVEGNQIPMTSDEPLGEDSIPFEGSGRLNTGKVGDDSLDVNSYSERRLESLDGLYEHEYAEQGNEDIAGFDNKNKLSFAGDAEMQIMKGTLLVDGCNSNITAADIDDIHEQSGVHPEFHNSDIVAAEGSMDDHGLCLNDNLIINKCSSEGYWDQNVCQCLMDSVRDQSDACGNESNSVCTQQAAAVWEGGIDDDQKADCPSEGVENVQNLGVKILMTDLLSKEAGISQNNGSSNYDTQHESEDSTFAIEDALISSSGGVFHDIEVNVLKIDVLPEDAETSVSQKNGGLSCEMQHELEDVMCSTEEQDTTKFPEKSGNDTKQDHPVIKPPPDAVPFSDEWLAAYEAAGEEILTKKGGAVQNSPPDKSLPEPGPWSPVKRKNNQGIGPFDCTKFTNANINTPPNSS